TPHRAMGCRRLARGVGYVRDSLAELSLRTRNFFPRLLLRSGHGCNLAFDLVAQETIPAGGSEWPPLPGAIGAATRTPGGSLPPRCRLPPDELGVRYPWIGHEHGPESA